MTCAGRKRVGIPQIGEREPLPVADIGVHFVVAIFPDDNAEVFFNALKRHRPRFEIDDLALLDKLRFQGEARGVALDEHAWRRLAFAEGVIKLDGGRLASQPVGQGSPAEGNDSV